jgi:hypothetical protein
LNANPKSETLFKVGTRQLSPDFSAVGPEHNACDLGQISGSKLIEVSKKLLQIGTTQLIDADPHLVVAGRRGRFLARPVAAGKLRLFDAADATRAYLELTPAEMPSYLDGAELATSAEAPQENPIEILSTPDRRMGLVVGLLVLSATLLGGSAYFTFQDAAFDSDVEYSAVPPEQLPALRQRVTGVFATGKGETPRTITMRPEGTVTFVEFGPGNAAVDHRDDTYKLALQDGKTPVARTTRLGPIQVSDAKTLLYAGEIYTRQP